MMDIILVCTPRRQRECRVEDMKLKNEKKYSALRLMKISWDTAILIHSYSFNALTLYLYLYLFNYPPILIIRGCHNYTIKINTVYVCSERDKTLVFIPSRHQVSIVGGRENSLRCNSSHCYS